MTENLAEARVTIDNVSDIGFLFGNQDSNIKFIEQQFKVRIVTRDGEIAIIGEEQDVQAVKELFFNR